jgi:hypothetical protein
MYNTKLVDLSGARKENISKTEFMSMNETVRLRTSESCVEV